MKNERVLDIEHAIETVRLFKEQKGEETHARLQKSVDLIKMYTTLYRDMQQGTDEQKKLSERILDAAKGYNEELYREKIGTSTLAGIIKRFFLRMAGKRGLELLAESEIPIPQKYSTEKIKSVLVSIQKRSDLDHGLARQEELDLFRTKVVSLLQEYKEVPFGFEEAITLVKMSPIEHLFEEGSYLTHESIVHLSQKISPLPGVVVVAEGAFQRDIHHRQLVTPLKESFTLKCDIFQTGFCYPIQHVGLALHEKLFPSCILRPSLVPRFQELLHKRQEIATALSPGNKLYNKAKGLIKQKSTLFRSIEPQIALLKAHHSACHDDCPKVLDTFETLSQKARNFAQNAFGTPIISVQEEWLLNHNQKILSHPVEECSRIYLESAIKGPLYSSKTADAFIQAGLSLYLMQLSEHLHFSPRELSSFERKVLISLIRQQLIFIYELEELTPNLLEKHVLAVIKQEIALFTEKEADDRFTLEAKILAEELINYYIERSAT